MTTRWLHEARSVEGPSFRIGRRDRTWVAEWDTFLRLEVEDGQPPRVELLEDSLATKKLLEGAVPALLGHLAGSLHWHASACAWPGESALLVLGASGAGKSTLVAGLGSVGAAFLADDVACVEARGATFSVVRREKRHAIRPDVVPMLYGTEARTKALFTPRRRRASAPLGLIVALEEGSELELSELPPRTRVQVLQQNLVRFALDDPALLARDLEMVLKLASTPVFRLVRPRPFTDWERLADLLRPRLRGAVRGEPR